MGTIFGIDFGGVARRLGVGSGASTVPIRRYELLRHSRFVQFPRMEFREELSPHQLHWSIQDALEDQGVTDITAYTPTINTFWSKVPLGESGKDRNVADYCIFDGGVKGRRGEALPLWLKIAPFIATFVGVLLGAAFKSPAFMGCCIVVAIGFLLYAAYWKLYKCGEVFVLYRGSYNTPEGSSTDSQTWRFSVDIMFSINLKKPIGMPMVGPVYDAVSKGLISGLKSDGQYRIQPELITQKPEQLEARFPVERVDLL